MKEAIVNAEDRNLDSGLGHWTGDAEWEPGPVEGQQGVMKFEVPSETEGLEESLSYPNIVIPSGITFFVSQLSIVIPFYVPGVGASLTLTDGVITIGPLIIVGGSQATWTRNLTGFNIPEEWDETEGTLIITIDNPYDEDQDMYFDEFKTQYQKISKVQYLPIVGMG
jgi:hypothetical protein